MYIPKYKAGDVFSELRFGRPLTYWKITNFRQGTDEHHSGKSSSYQVVQCNKNGKEFRKTTSFYAVGIDEKIDHSEGHRDGTYRFIGHVDNLIKVSREGLQQGVIKRRIKFLKDRMLADATELGKLTNQI